MHRSRKTRNREAAAATEFPDQDPHSGGRGARLEEAIGHEVRRFREKLDITLSEFAKAAGISAGMLSKIENRATSLSLSSLQSLSRALQVPVTSLFRSL